MWLTDSQKNAGHSVRGGGLLIFNITWASTRGCWLKIHTSKKVKTKHWYVYYFTSTMRQNNINEDHRWFNLKHITLVTFKITHCCLCTSWNRFQTKKKKRSIECETLLVPSFKNLLHLSVTHEKPQESEKNKIK